MNQMEKPATDRTKFAACLIAGLFYMYCLYNSIVNNDVAARIVLFALGSIVFPYSIFNIYPTVQRTIFYFRNKSTTTPNDILMILGDFAELLTDALLLGAIISQVRWSEFSSNRREMMIFLLTVNSILQAGTWGYKKIFRHN